MSFQLQQLASHSIAYCLSDQLGSASHHRLSVSCMFPAIRCLLPPASQLKDLAPQLMAGPAFLDMEEIFIEVFTTLLLFVGSG